MRKAGSDHGKTPGKDIWALKDISFSINEGEVVGIIGPNGAGKTTLCRALCGILKPDLGTTTIDGRVTALLTYQAGFKFDLSGKDNIYLNGMMLGLSEKEVRGLFDDIVKCGVDALHPIEPKAMDIAEVKEKFGSNLCLLGHVDVDLLSRGTEDEVRKKVRENIEKAGYNGGYCAGSGNSVPEYVDYNNYLAMIDETKKFKY